MTDAPGNLATQTRDGVSLLKAAVAGLFFFVIWKSSGISLDLAPQTPDQLKEAIYEGLETRAVGRSSLVEQLVWFVFALFGLYLHILNKDRARYTWTKATFSGCFLCFAMFRSVRCALQSSQIPLQHRYRLRRPRPGPNPFTVLERNARAG